MRTDPQSSGDPTPQAESLPADLIKIGEFATRAGTNLRTLRYYEEVGLLEPAARSQGGFRYYRVRDLHRLTTIRELQELGLPLERIRVVLDTRSETPDRATRMGRIRAALEEQSRLLAERAAAIAAQKDHIDEALGKLVDCENCRHTPNAANNFCEPCEITGRDLPPKMSALF